LPTDIRRPLVGSSSCIYDFAARISCDHAKRDWTLANCGLGFKDAALIFDGLTAEVEDRRKDCGETRIICFGVPQNRLVVMGYTAAWRSASCLQHEKGKST